MAVQYFTHRGQDEQSEFKQLFTIDPELLDIDNISANLRDRILVISVLKMLHNIEVQATRIPISMSKKEEVTPDDTVARDTEEGKD